MRRSVAMACALLAFFWKAPVWANPPLKPPLSGLVLMGVLEFHRHDGGVPDNSLAILEERPGVFSGIDINITWEQLQPAPGPIVTDALDQALDSVRAYNKQHVETPVAIKLRVWGGPNAPQWVKASEGAPVSIVHITKQDVLPLTVGRFWSEKYRQQWRELQRQLAAKYDSEPLIREVAASSCSSMTDEPFVFPGDAQSLQNMRAAGYNDRAIYDCLISEPNAYRDWRSTRLEFPFNPFRRSDAGRIVLDQDATFVVMKAWRQALGAQAILSNHGARSPLRPWLRPSLEHIKALGPPIEMQASAPTQTDWDAVVADAIDRGATAFEMWSRTGPDTVLDRATPEQFQRWSQGLKANLARLGK